MRNSRPNDAKSAVWDPNPAFDSVDFDVDVSKELRLAAVTHHNTRSAGDAYDA